MCSTNFRKIIRICFPNIMRIAVHVPAEVVETEVAVDSDVMSFHVMHNYLQLFPCRISCLSCISSISFSECSALWSHYTLEDAVLEAAKGFTAYIHFKSF